MKNNRTKLSESNINVSKQKSKADKKKREAVSNKKHKNNKILKAKEILIKNKTSLVKQSEDKEDVKRSLSSRVLRYVKNTFFGIVIVLFAIALISFVIVRINGGTPNVFGYSIQRITSGSMEPALQVGDIILSKSVAKPEEIKVGDIVTFQGGSEYEHKLITHRVIAQPVADLSGNYYLTTMGDANETVDSEILFSDVKSKFLLKIDFLNKFYDFFMSPWGLIVFIAALVIIFFDELLTVVKVFTGNYDEDEDDEDENVREIMERLKREEEEEKLRLEAEKERKRRISEKYGSTSKKKQKAQKQQRSKEKKQERVRNTQPQNNVNKNNRKKNQSRKKHKKSSKK